MLKVPNSNKISPINRTEMYMNKKENRDIKSKPIRNNISFDEILNKKIEELNFLKGSKNER